MSKLIQYTFCRSCCTHWFVTSCKSVASRHITPNSFLKAYHKDPEHVFKHHAKSATVGGKVSQSAFFVLVCFFQFNALWFIFSTENGTCKKSLIFTVYTRSLIKGIVKHTTNNIFPLHFSSTRILSKAINISLISGHSTESEYKMQKY